MCCYCMVVLKDLLADLDRGLVCVGTWQIHQWDLDEGSGRRVRGLNFVVSKSKTFYT